MADEFHGDASVAVKLLFERKNAEGELEAAAYDADAPWTPCPELRADVVSVSHAPGLELASEAEVEPGEVGEDGERRLAALGLSDEFAHGANERRQVAQDFGDADHGHFGVVGDRVDAGGA